MDFNASRGRKTGLFVCAWLFALALHPAYGQAMEGYTDWAGNENGKIRLLAGEEQAAGARYAGLEFKLADGWKTYWRSPGDSGIPPEFDWSASKNVKSIEVKWPAPSRFKDDFGDNVGYKSAVLFPVVIQPVDPKAPVDLELTAHFGICSNVCIPASAELSLTVPPGGVAANQPAIARSLRTVPAKSVSGLRVKSAGVLEKDSKVMLDVKIDASRAGDMDVFVEGPMEYYFTMPKPVSKGPGKTRVFQLSVDGAKTASELSGSPVVVTVVQGDLGLEQKLILE